MSDHTYTEGFFEGQSAKSYESARVVIPIVRQLLPVASVCDVGCGVAPWLRAWIEAGVTDVLGLDGDYVNRTLLEISAAQFKPTDLKLPFNPGRTFDLAMCLEVAEHLPPERAKGLVADIVKLAPVVLFSAAIPKQGGTYHVNEQWPEYWSVLFSQMNYQVCDVIRPLVWDEPKVEPWYRQNILMFAAPSAIQRHPALGATLKMPLTVVHPEFYMTRPNNGNRTELARHLYWCICRDFRKIWKRW